jgi:hypothetical protein
MSVTSSLNREKVRVTLLIAAACVVTGCPATGPSGPPPIAGTWSGTLTCERTQSLGTATAPPETSTITFEITFDDAGVPAAILILGFLEAPNQEASIAQVGASATQTAAAGVLLVTQEVTVSSASFGDTIVQIGFQIDYSASGGALAQSGTGTQSFTATVNGEALDIAISTGYQVNQRSGVVNLDTGEQIMCSGTLQRQ